jgi:phage baseplate assembly protein gpV
MMPCLVLCKPRPHPKRSWQRRAEKQCPWHLGRSQTLTTHTETAWLQSIRTHPGLDSPIPKVGDTVVVAYCDGDSHNGGVYLGTTHNDIVKPLDKRNIDKDYGESVPGDYILDVEGSILIKNKAGASIKLTEDGEIVLTDKRGNKVTLSSWFGDVAFSGNVTIAGKEATVLGATDNKGHTLVSKGY